MEMSVKPSEVFVGVIDFFSALVPGAIATFLLVSSKWIKLQDLETPNRYPQIEWGSPAGWAVFLVAAYVMGQLIAAVGSRVLDPLYDCLYVRWRRITPNYVRCQLLKGSAATGWTVFRCRIKHVFKFKTCAPDDALLCAAKTLKSKQLTALARDANVCASDISNTFWWAGTVARMRTPDGAAEIDALSAQSKFFRGIVVLLPLVTIWRDWPSWWAKVLILVLFALSLWRFMWLRWGATERAYEYFIAATLLPPKGRGDGTGRRAPPVSFIPVRRRAGSKYRGG